MSYRTSHFIQLTNLYNSNLHHQIMPLVHILRRNPQFETDLMFDNDFGFWINHLPRSLKEMLELRRFPQPLGEQRTAIQSFRLSSLPGIIKRLLERATTKEHSMEMRRSALLSLKIIFEV